jgi:hypothetical protein
VGVIIGYGRRGLINLPVGLSNDKCKVRLNIIFRIDTGSAITTLSR